MPLSGYSKANDNCIGKKPSSVAKIKIMEANYLTTATYDTDSKKYSAVAITTGKTAQVYEFEAGQAEIKVGAVTENKVTKYVSTLTFKAEKLSDKYLDVIDEFVQHSYCGMVAEVETFYGERYFIGNDPQYGTIAPLELSEGELTSGRTLTGEQGGDIVLVSETPNRPRLFADGITLPLPT
jgi:hypothetical protein